MTETRFIVNSSGEATLNVEAEPLSHIAEYATEQSMAYEQEAAKVATAKLLFGWRKTARQGKVLEEITEHTRQKYAKELAGKLPIDAIGLVTNARKAGRFPPHTPRQPRSPRGSGQ